MEVKGTKFISSPNSYFFNKKVCILIPTYNNNDVLQRCLNYLHRLNPQPSYYIFLGEDSQDNTMETIKHWKTLYPNTISLKFPIGKLNINSNNPYEKIGLVRQILLEEARKLSVDYAIFIDDDIFLADKDFIERITYHKKDLVGGAYFRCYPQGKLLSYLTFNKGKDKDTHPYILRNYIKKALFKVAATSGGCLCISNKLLMDKRVNFYPIPDYYNSGNAGEDFAYCVTARKNGYTVWVDDTFQICHYQKHEARPWRVKGD